jgi:hypothetical protein
MTQVYSEATSLDLKDVEVSRKPWMFCYTLPIRNRWEDKIRNFEKIVLYLRYGQHNFFDLLPHLTFAKNYVFLV